MQLDQALIKR